MFCGDGQGAGKVSTREVGLHGTWGRGRWEKEKGNAAPRGEEETRDVGLPACPLQQGPGQGGNGFCALMDIG